jgi:hypothetical protein
MGTLVTNEETGCTCLECDFRFFPDTKQILWVAGPNGEAIPLPVESVKTEEVEPGGIRLVGLVGSVPIDRKPELQALVKAMPTHGVLLPPVGDKTTPSPTNPLKESTKLDAEGEQPPERDESIDISIPSQSPRKLLKGWHEITEALEMRYNQRADIKSLNERYQGPIRNRGKGTKPMVYKEDLIDWWNKLAIMEQEFANRREGSNLSAEAQHDYGREGRAAPEISGEVKKRRRDKSN